MQRMLASMGIRVGTGQRADRGFSGRASGGSS